MPWNKKEVFPGKVGQGYLCGGHKPLGRQDVVSVVWRADNPDVAERCPAVLAHGPGVGEGSSEASPVRGVGNLVLFQRVDVGDRSQHWTDELVELSGLDYGLDSREQSGTKRRSGPQDEALVDQHVHEVRIALEAPRVTSQFCLCPDPDSERSGRGQPLAGLVLVGRSKDEASGYEDSEVGVTAH